ncbi:MAG: ExeM/NucH family extracellular endonuclease [Planctomycetota bacterium]
MSFSTFSKPSRTLRDYACLLVLSLFWLAGCKPNDQPVEMSGTTDPEDALTSADSEAPGEDYVIVDGDLDAVDWREMVGKRVGIEGDLVVVDTYDLIRRGQVRLARKRLVIPTSYIDPNDKDSSGTSFEGGNNVAKVTAAQKFNETATVTIDDGSVVENVFPPDLFPGLGTELETVRVGSVVAGVSGTIVMIDGKPVLVSDAALDFTPAKRPACPDMPANDLKVASFNVLNYFTTLDDGQNNARGADTASEFARQESKIVAAMAEMNADVIGLMELENNIEAEEKLVEALNKSIGEDVYIACGLPDNFSEAPGSGDSIRVGIIYRSDRVTPKGPLTLVNDPAFYIARTPLVQTFESTGGGEPFSVIVNHFKSKGGGDVDEANKNKGDGQAAYNAARREQALALTRYIEAEASDTPARFLVIGDLNAYQQEDPIDALRAEGMIDLHEKFQSADGGTAMPEYSFVYYGQCGSLDHAFATPALAADVTTVATWHINSDEPRFVDYNEEYNPASLFKPNPYRSSDHDPVLISIKNRADD